MTRGVVVWFDPCKGYGFIKTDTREVYIHYTNIIMEGFKLLHPGDFVEFDLYESKIPGKYEAKSLIKLDK